jgi:tetratricopeptide (TPR) repeat protein
MRAGGLGLCFLLGCTALPTPVREPAQSTVAEPVEPTEPPKARLDEADDPLTVAAESLARGDQLEAARHFELYVKQHPEQVMFRLHLADLLFNMHRLEDAQAHYERFIADAESSTGPPRERLVHCHTRLMDIARINDDRFAELLHRGIGLVRLTRQEIEDPETSEEILCQAIRALKEAQDERPTDPRVHVYLAEAFERAGNRRAAEVSRAAARNFALPGLLTAKEAHDLAAPNAN